MLPITKKVRAYLINNYGLVSKVHKKNSKANKEIKNFIILKKILPEEVTSLLNESQLVEYFASNVLNIKTTAASGNGIKTQKRLTQLAFSCVNIVEPLSGVILNGRCICNKLNHKKPADVNETLYYQGLMFNLIINKGSVVEPVIPMTIKEVKSAKINIDLSSLKKPKSIKEPKQNKDKKIKKQEPKELNKKKPFAYKDYRKEASDFYKTNAWRKLRYEALREQEGRCQLCGRTSKDGVVMHCDHITPLSKDWSRRLDKNNIQVLCEDCNLGKSNTDSIDWR